MLDLKAEYRLFGDELRAALFGVLDSGQFILGPQGTTLERELAQYCGVEHGVAVANGTEALHLALGYNERLAGTGVVRPPEHGRGRHIYHQYTLRSPKRDAIKAALDTAKIGAMIYYPIPLHQQDVWQEPCRGVSLPHSEEAARTVVSLPMFPMLTEEQIGRVCEVVKAAVRS